MKALRIVLAVTVLAALLGGITLWSAAPSHTLVAQAQDDGWATDWSKKLGLALLAEFDSSGPPAWDPVAHPLVFFTTEGPGYSGQLSKTHNLPGVAIIDANTREPIASAAFELEGGEPGKYFEPHGLGVSKDGRWIYLPTGVSAGFGDVGTGRLLIIDALTLKLNKVLSAPTNPHHAKAFTNSEGKDLVLSYGFRQGNFYVLDPNDNNRVVGGILNNDLFGRGYLGYVDQSGKYLFISVRPPSGVESEGNVAIVDTTTWQLVRNIGVHDESPIWVSFTADNRTAYVSGGHESLVIRIDMSDPNPGNWAVTGLSRAGLEGPYGVHLNWDDSQIWTVGKGEGSHNLGIELGLVDPKRFVAGSTARPLAVYNTGCLRADHGTLNPNPDVSELWLTCNSSFEVVVFDMAAKAVAARIPMPNGGSTHSGSFVQYSVDEMGGIVGEVLSDQNGLHGSALAIKKEILGL